MYQAVVRKREEIICYEIYKGMGVTAKPGEEWTMLREDMVRANTTEPVINNGDFSKNWRIMYLPQFCFTLSQYIFFAGDAMYWSK
jgi:hypothetical protein